MFRRDPWKKLVAIPRSVARPRKDAVYPSEAWREHEREGEVKAYSSRRHRCREVTTVNWLRLGSFVLALGLSVSANAQERNVNAAYRDADVRTVLQQLGEVTKTNVLIEDGVEGKVTFLSNGPMTADEFRSAFVSLLADLGYQVSERDGVLFIGPIKP